METLIDSNPHQIAEPFTLVHTLCETQVNQNRASMTTPRCGMLGSADARERADIRPPRLYYALARRRGTCRAAGFKVTSKLIITVTSHAGASHVTILRSKREKRQAPRFKATDSLADERRSLQGPCHLRIYDVPCYVTMIKYRSRSVGFPKIIISHHFSDSYFYAIVVMKKNQVCK